MEASRGMLNISGKNVTSRAARADGLVLLGPEAFAVLEHGTCIKGDVITTAKVAAIQAVKSTPSLIPMCHPILVEAVEVGFELRKADLAVLVAVEVKSSGKTGVEMEALCGVSAACLTIYDMLKYTGKTITIEKMRLVKKTGGKSDDFQRSD